MCPPCVIGPPAHADSRTGRFQNVTELRLAGLDLTDASARLLVRFLPHLTRLDLSQCGSITDQTVHTLTSPISPLRESLIYLNLAGKACCITSCLCCLLLSARAHDLCACDLCVLQVVLRSQISASHCCVAAPPCRQWTCAPALSCPPRLDSCFPSPPHPRPSPPRWPSPRHLCPPPPALLKTEHC